MDAFAVHFSSFCCLLITLLSLKSYRNRRVGRTGEPVLLSSVNVLRQCFGLRRCYALARIGKVLMPVILTALLSPPPLPAAQVTLAWDPNDPTPDGYRVYHRLEGQNYDYSSPSWPLSGAVSTNTTCTIENLDDDTTYYFVVRAFSGTDESGNSNEVRHHTDPPVVSNPPPVSETHTITVTSGSNGTISPGTVTVGAGESQTFTIAAASHYHVADVVVDGQSVGPVTTYTFSDVDRDHAISASFSGGAYTITATAGPNGGISPGTVTVSAGASQVYNISPAGDYRVADVVVDGQSIGSVTTYTFSNVDRDHTIDASFESGLYTISATAGPNGQIFPSGDVGVEPGGHQTFQISADEGYEIEALIVDGVTQSSESSYTFHDVLGAHRISVTFTRVDNQPPIADAGPDQKVDEKKSVTLNGLNSIDHDDGLSNFRWRQISGPQVDLSATDEDVVTFIAPDVDGNGAALEFELVVTDFSGATAKDCCIVNVTWINEVPKADAGEDQTVAEGDAVRLTGEGSMDPDDGVSRYEWRQTEGPIVRLDDSASVSPGFMAPTGGPDGTSLVFQLSVTDNGGLRDTDTCTVTVEVENQGPVADAGPDQRVELGSEVTLDGVASTDPEGFTLTYHWRQTDGFPIVLSDATAMTPVFTLSEDADQIDPELLASTLDNVLVFELTVTDIGGLSSVDTCEIVVALASQDEDEESPEIGILEPSRSRIYTRKSKISISGNASDNRRVDRVEWTNHRGNGGQAMGTDQWCIDDLPLEPWKNTITITAYDSAGNTQSKTITIYAFYQYFSFYRYR